MQGDDCQPGAEYPVAQPDLLLLDELDGSIWMQRRLSGLSVFLADSWRRLFVTHDRYFLDRVATRNTETDDARIYEQSRELTAPFFESKAIRETVEANSERRRQSFLRHELFVRAGARGRGTRQQSRLDERI